MGTWRTCWLIGRRPVCGAFGKARLRCFHWQGVTKLQNQEGGTHGSDTAGVFDDLRRRRRRARPIVLGIDLGPLTAYAEEIKKIDKLKTAKQSTSVCCYCAVGCGLICSTDVKTGKIINIEEIRSIPSTKDRCAPRGPASFRPRPPTNIALPRSCIGRLTATSGR